MVATVHGTNCGNGNDDDDNDARVDAIGLMGL